MSGDRFPAHAASMSTGSASVRAGAQRVLLVTRRFPPHSDPTSYRWLRFVMGLVERRWEVEVLTVFAEPTAAYHDEGLVAMIPPGVVVHRVNPGPIDRRVMRERRRKVEADARIGAAVSTHAHNGPRHDLRSRVRDALRRTYEALVPMVSPDVTIEWVPWAVRAGRRLLRERRFDVVVSSSSPFSAHVAAQHITRGSGVPWVGDFSDPFADNVFLERPGWRKPIDRRFERGWLNAMDGVIVPVEEMAELFCTRYPRLSRGRVHVIPYGYPEELYDAIEPNVLVGFTIVHTGAFYPGLRDPMPTFRALPLVREVPFTLHHAGGMTPEYLRFFETNGVADRFVYHGYLGKREVVGLQKGASCLLAVGNKGGHQLPGKLLDYIGAKRPILMLKNDPHDIAADLVAATRTGLVVANDTEAIANGIRQMYGWWKDGTLDSRFDLGAGREYSWVEQERRVDAVLRGHARRG